MARKVTATFGVPFMDVFVSTQSRPGGHRFSSKSVGDVRRPARRSTPQSRRTETDCAHYCIPGPLNDWAISLLAFWTVD